METIFFAKVGFHKWLVSLRYTAVALIRGRHNWIGFQSDPIFDKASDPDPFLKKKLPNSNINVAIVAIKAGAALTKNLKKDFAADVKGLMNPVLLKFKKKGCGAS